ncbi:hypothetical protein BASA81_006220 [Batrachochytrium salamandrivorans]|nr:hypothetical protein BASA81_006220 [Batrachochytrium salamandrivorans]
MAGRGKLMTKPAWLVQREREEAQAGGGGSGEQAMFGLLPPPFAGAAPPPSFGTGGPPVLPSPFAMGPPPPGGVLPPPFALPNPYQSAPRQRSPPSRSSSGGNRAPPPKRSYDDRGPPPPSNLSTSDVRSRKMFVSGTQGLKEDELLRFFNQKIAELTNHQVSRAVVHITANDSKNIAFVEFAQTEMMHAVLELQSLQFGNKSLRFQKPKDFELNRPLGPIPRLGGGNFHATPSVPPPTRGGGGDTSEGKLMVDNIPLDMTEQQFAGIFASYGPLRSAQLFVPGKGAVDYADPRCADTAYMQLPSSSACYGMRLSRPSTAPPPPTNVLLLLNMVTRDEVKDPKEYAEIVEDVEGEAKRFGQVKQVIIPRFGGGVGRVFIAYVRAEDAVKAHTVMHNRKFSGRTVEGKFYPEDAFNNLVYDAEV